MGADEDMPELTLDTAGGQLERARETQGQSRSDVARLTRIPERHLLALEQGNYAVFPARTYAIGFAKTYARAVGLNEIDIAKTVRSEIDGSSVHDSGGQSDNFEPGDPARVPSKRLAWIAAAVAGLVVIAGLVFWNGAYNAGGTLPSTLPPEPKPQIQPIAAPVLVAVPAALPTNGPVIFTALASGIWVKFYDASGTQLIQKQMAQGESYTIPDGANGPKIWTGRPEALAITIGGHEVPKLAEVQKTVKDMPVSAAALLARVSPVAVGPVVPAPTTASTYGSTSAAPAATIPAPTILTGAKPAPKPALKPAHRPAHRMAKPAIPTASSGPEVKQSEPPTLVPGPVVAPVTEKPSTAAH